MGRIQTIDVTELQIGPYYIVIHTKRSYRAPESHFNDTSPSFARLRLSDVPWKLQQLPFSIDTASSTMTATIKLCQLMLFVATNITNTNHNEPPQSSKSVTEISINWPYSAVNSIEGEVDYPPRALRKRISTTSSQLLNTFQIPQS